MAAPTHSVTQKRYDLEASSKQPTPQLKEKINQLISEFQSTAISREDAVTAAHAFLGQIEERSVGEACEICGFLLPLPIEEIQLVVAEKMSSLLDIRFLKDDLEPHQAERIIHLETQLSDLIEQQLRLQPGGSKELLLLALNLYEGILERLWLLPFLPNGQHLHALIREQAIPSILHRTERWLSLCEKQATHESDFRSIFASLQRWFGRLKETDRKGVIQKIQALEPSSDPIIFLFSLASLYQGIQEYRRAIFHCENGTQIFDGQVDQLKLHVVAKMRVLCGTCYEAQGEHQKSIDILEKGLEAAKKLGNAKLQAQAWGNLGNSYFYLGEYQKAIECQEECLKIVTQELTTAAEKAEWLMMQATTSHVIGTCFHYQGDYQKAIDYFNRSLGIATDLKSPGLMARFSGALGNAYSALGQYEKAIESQTITLENARQIDDKSIEAGALGNIGYVYHTLGQYEKAIQFHSDALEIALKFGMLSLVDETYNGLGTAYTSLGKYVEAHEYYDLSLQYSKELGDRNGEGQTLSDLANVLRMLANEQRIKEQSGNTPSLTLRGKFFRQPEEIYKAAQLAGQQGVAIAQEVRDSITEANATGNLGLISLALAQHADAIVSFEHALAIYQKAGQRKKETETHMNLGSAYVQMKKYTEAERHFRAGIEMNESLEKEMKNRDEWRITFFEEQAQIYIALENLLFDRGDKQEALRITDTRRSRALTDILLKRETAVAGNTPLSIPEIQGLAKKFNTSFVVYSLAPLSQKSKQVVVWVVPPQGDIFSKQIALEAIAEGVTEFDALLEQYPFSIGTSRSATLTIMDEIEEVCRGRHQALMKKKVEEFRKNLSIWYQTLIQPIASELPQSSGAKVTFILDGFLSQLPYAIFTDENEKYLIERYTISFAPSIKMLQILDAQKQTMKPGLSNCLIGNPDTGNSEDHLPQAEVEVGKVARLFDTKTKRLVGKDAKIGNVAAAMQEARYIHLACHGDPKQKIEPHSVFEGGFLLSPDDETPSGVLYAQKIANIALRAELVFMSACYSGRGKIQQEGVIGPMRSFLAAGVPSSVGAHWRLPDSELTVDMVTQFYQHILGISEKAEVEKRPLDKDEALREVMLMAISRERGRPHAWGAFFLTGLVYSNFNFK